MLCHMVAVDPAPVVDLDDPQPVLEMLLQAHPLSSTWSKTPNFTAPSPQIIARQRSPRRAAILEHGPELRVEADRRRAHKLASMAAVPMVKASAPRPEWRDPPAELTEPATTTAPFAGSPRRQAATRSSGSASVAR